MDHWTSVTTSAHVALANVKEIVVVMFHVVGVVLDDGRDAEPLELQGPGGMYCHRGDPISRGKNTVLIFKLATSPLLMVVAHVGYI